ncbi:MAG: serine/threonine protein kinase [Rhodothermia bacterium]|nr:serine/threonine protein kinase [Rhodothermia bacterium]
MDQITFWQQVQTAFDTYEGLEAVETQAAFLESLSLNEPEVYAALRPLITNDTSVGSSLLPDLSEAFNAHIPPWLEQVGLYKLEKVLGHGSSGTVFLVTRPDLHGQKLAMKIFWHSSQNKNTQSIFEKEIRTLSHLRHPGLPLLTDGGIFEGRFFYLVMEYVAGRPLLDYADEKKATLHERVQLFRQCLNIIHYAHKQGIIHRDLKPQHILVTTDGQIKILDFGIAKWTSTTYSDYDERTQSLVFTPAYASPEQLIHKPCSFHSDQFALGLILYELCCGFYPYSSKASNAIERITQSKKPISSMLERFGGANQAKDPKAQIAATNRNTTPRILIQNLKSGLSHIASKTLEEDPQNRFASVMDLDVHLERWIENKTVFIKRRTNLNTTINYLKKNYFILFVTFIFVLSTAVFWFYVNKREKKTIQYLENMILKDEEIYLEYPIPDNKKYYTKHLIKNHLELNQIHFQNNHEVQLEIIQRIIQLAILNQLEPVADSLLTLVERQYTSKIKETRFQVLFMQRKARLAGMRGQLAQATMYYDQAISKASQMSLSLIERGGLLYESALFEGRSEQYEKALTRLQTAEKLFANAGDPKSLMEMACKLEMGRIWMWIGNYRKAHFFLKQTYELVRAKLPQTHPMRLAVLYDYGNVLQYQNKIAESILILKELLPIAQRIYGTNHFVTGYYTASYAYLLRENGQTRKAIHYDLKAIHILKKDSNSEAIPLAKSYRNMAMTYAGLKNKALAMSYADTAIIYFKKAYSSQHFQVLKAVFTKLDLQRIFSSEFEQTASGFNKLIQTFNVQGNKGLFAILARIRLADLLTKESNRWNEAKRLISEAETIISIKENKLPDVLGEISSIKGFLLFKRGDKQDGMMLMENGYQQIRQVVGADDPIAKEAQLRLIKARQATSFSP